MSWASALTEDGVGGSPTPDFRQCRGMRAVGSLEAAHPDGGEEPMHRHGWWQALLVLARSEERRGKERRGGGGACVEKEERRSGGRDIDGTRLDKSKVAMCAW